MKTYKVLSLLLSYPETGWLEALPEMQAALAGEAEFNGNAAKSVAPLLAMLRELSLIELQEIYVATFDRNPSHSLHLFEHIHGESRERGSAMVNLLEEYWKHGFDASAVRAAGLPAAVSRVSFPASSRRSGRTAGRRSTRDCVGRA